MKDNCRTIGRAHKWVVRDGSYDPAKRRLMDPRFGPWYECSRCGWATSPQFQEPGWNPRTDKVDVSAKERRAREDARARSIHESVAKGAFPQAERLYPTD